MPIGNINGKNGIAKMGTNITAHISPNNKLNNVPYATYLIDILVL